MAHSMKKIIGVLCVLFMVSACSLALGWMDTVVDDVHAYPREHRMENGLKYGILDIVPSPDGAIIAFTYIEMDSAVKNLVGVGLYHRATDTIERLANPEGHMLMEPNFSYDGKKMLFGIAVRQATIPLKISEYDMRSKKHTILYDIHEQPNDYYFPRYPTYQPETGHIAFFIRVEPAPDIHKLVLLNPKTKAITTLIPPEEGYGIVHRPSFLSKDEMIFQAGFPISPEAEQKANQLKQGSSMEGISYMLRLNGKPQIVSEKLESEDIVFAELEGVSASLNGEIVYARYIGHLHRMKKDKSGKILRELYFYNKGNPIELTDKNEFIDIPKISAEGNIVAFGADFDEPRLVDIYLYDISTKKILSTNIMKRISADPQFQLP
jgi:hypothetical protein